MTVTFASTKAGVSLPFGQDRGPLYYLINKAIATYRQLDATLPSTMDPIARAAKLDTARFVEWDAATEYLGKMGKGSSGKDYRILVDRMKRPSFLWERRSATDSRWSDFFSDFVQYHVPVPLVACRGETNSIYGV